MYHSLPSRLSLPAAEEEAAELVIMVQGEEESSWRMMASVHDHDIQHLNQATLAYHGGLHQAHHHHHHASATPPTSSFLYYCSISAHFPWKIFFLFSSYLSSLAQALSSCNRS
jgi:hypothetical protein